MKKLILPVCFFVFIGCSKKDNNDDTSSSKFTTVTFNNAYLTGTWDINKEEYYNLANDSLKDADHYDKGYLMLTFGADNSLIATEDGDSDNIGSYSIVKKGNKNILVFYGGGGNNDSSEVVSYSSTTMVLSDKMDAITSHDNFYSKMYLTKH
jgi:hypothetical protein